MKIVFNIHGTYNSGGMERVLSNKVNYLAQIPNYEVYIVTTGQKGRPHFYEISSKVKCIDLGVNYAETLDGNPIVRIFRSTIKYFKHKRKLKNLLYGLKADIAVSMFTNDVSFLYKINDGSKKILEIHFSREFRLLEKRKGIIRLMDLCITYLYDKIVCKYDRFVVLTNQDKESWKSQENISVIYNSVTSEDTDIVSSLKSKKALAVGRLSFQKNIELLIELWGHVSKKYPDWSLVIIGTGDLKELLDKITKMNLQGVIELVPTTNSIGDYYKESSMYLMTSRYEGLPMVLLEAQYYGLPIVSFDCKCGPREIINDGKDGYLIANNNAIDFVAKVCLLLENEILRKEFGKNAKINSQKFSEKKIMGQWITLFEELKNETAFR